VFVIYLQTESVRIPTAQDSALGVSGGLRRGQTFDPGSTCRRAGIFRKATGRGIAGTTPVDIANRSDNAANGAVDIGELAIGAPGPSKVGRTAGCGSARGDRATGENDAVVLAGCGGGCTERSAITADLTDGRTGYKDPTVTIHKINRALDFATSDINRRIGALRIQGILPTIQIGGTNRTACSRDDEDMIGVGITRVAIHELDVLDRHVCGGDRQRGLVLTAGKNGAGIARTLDDEAGFGTGDRELPGIRAIRDRDRIAGGGRINGSLHGGIGRRNVSGGGKSSRCENRCDEEGVYDFHGVTTFVGVLPRQRGKCP